jgi:hypothetical protein
VVFQPAVVVLRRSHHQAAVNASELFRRDTPRLRQSGSSQRSRHANSFAARDGRLKRDREAAYRAAPHHSRSRSRRTPLFPQCRWRPCSRTSWRHGQSRPFAPGTAPLRNPAHPRPPLVTACSSTVADDAPEMRTSLPCSHEPPGAGESQKTTGQKIATSDNWRYQRVHFWMEAGASARFDHRKRGTGDRPPWLPITPRQPASTDGTRQTHKHMHIEREPLRLPRRQLQADSQ